MGLKLYDTEWLCYVEEDDGTCTYWVLRLHEISGLYIKYKVKKRQITTAVTLFQNHPDGIKSLTPKEFRKLGYKNSNEYWDAKTALEHKAETTAELE